MIGGAIQLFEPPSFSLADFRRQLARIEGVTVEQAQRVAAELRREIDAAQRKAAAAGRRARRRHAEPKSRPLLTPMPVAPSTTFALTVQRGDR